MTAAYFLTIGLVIGLTSPLLSTDTSAPILIDARTKQEYERGHLEGSFLIPYDRISEGIGTVVKDKTQVIQLYCRSGRRSKVAKDTLNAMGYQNVIDLGSLENASKVLNRRIVVGNK